MRRIIVVAAFFAVCLFAAFSIWAFAQERPGGGPSQPEWWNGTDFEVARKGSVVAQYFFIVEDFLEPGYKVKGPEGEVFLKKSIIAFTRLIEWFQEERDMSTACAAQYQIAEAYKRLNDSARAKEAYKKCLDYRRYVNKPPKDMADTTILGIIRTCEKELEKMR